MPTFMRPMFMRQLNGKRLGLTPDTGASLSSAASSLLPQTTWMTTMKPKHTWTPACVAFLDAEFDSRPPLMSADSGEAAVNVALR